MKISAETVDGKIQLLFFVDLTCEHCNEPLTEEDIKEERELSKGVTNTCSICGAKIKTVVTMFEGPEPKKEGETDANI
jgi:NAD-dependent SIR2 family protein deacetylase